MQTHCELVHRRRQDEDGHDVRPRLLEKLHGALPVDVEQHVASGQQSLLNGGGRRRIVVSVHLGMFEERAGVASHGEVGGRDEVVVLPVHLVSASRACGDGDGEREVAIVAQQARRDRALASARG